MISEGSCDTDDYEVMMLTIQLCITEINDILKYIQIDKFQWYCQKSIFLYCLFFWAMLRSLEKSL